MVRTARPQSDNERLGEIIAALVKKHGLHLYASGWARTTYDVGLRDPRSRDVELLVRVESFATTSGEIRLVDPRGKQFAEELGHELEQTFPDIGEAVIIEDFT